MDKSKNILKNIYEPIEQKNILKKFAEPIGQRRHVDIRKDDNDKVTIVSIDGKEVMRSLSIKHPEQFKDTLEAVLNSGLEWYELLAMSDLVRIK